MPSGLAIGKRERGRDQEWLICGLAWQPGGPEGREGRKGGDHEDSKWQKRREGERERFSKIQN